MTWMTTYILVSIVGFYALLSLFLLGRMLKAWLGGSSSEARVPQPPLPNWTPPRETITPENRQQHLSA